jgi:hypothetical protein
MGNNYAVIAISYKRINRLFVQEPLFLCKRDFLCKANCTLLYAFQGSQNKKIKAK